MSDWAPQACFILAILLLLACPTPLHIALPPLPATHSGAPADAQEVAEQLLAAGYPATYLSGQRSQLQRIEALNALRDFRWAC